MDFTRCYGCMRELPAPGAVCPHCGYDNTNDPSDPKKQPSHVLPCGTVLNGQYMVGRSLGQGGFGITYIGYDLNLEIPVCIKEYYPEGSAMRSATQSRMVYWGTSENAQSMKESRKSFVKEAQKAVKLRDLSHVVTVWGVFYENETAYIVMDYIEGETLKSRLVRTQKSLTEKECVELLTPVMEDLEKAHKRGIIHRDIKPDNIMLTSDGEPVLLDMGAAKDLGKSLYGGNSSTMGVVSHGFSPLEQYKEKGGIGAWTDVYAMSATIYYCVTGKGPEPAIDRVIEDNVSFSTFTPAFSAVLRKGLIIRPENRIQTMGELWKKLSGSSGAPKQAAASTTGANNKAETSHQHYAYVRQQILERNAKQTKALPVGLAINDKGLYAYAFNVCSGQVLELYRKSFEPGESAMTILGSHGFDRMIGETIKELRGLYALRDVILTLSVPNEFGFTERFRIYDVGRLAGIRILRIISESSSVMWYSEYMQCTGDTQFTLCLTADSCMLFEVGDGVIEEIFTLRFPLTAAAKEHLQEFTARSENSTKLVLFNLPAGDAVTVQIKTSLRGTRFTDAPVQTAFSGAAAAGAAIQSAIFAHEMDGLIMLEETNYALCFSTEDHTESMIERFTTIPTRKSIPFELEKTTVIKIREDRGGRMWDLGSFLVALCEKTRVEITFDIDANRKTNVTVTDEKTKALLGKLTLP